MERPTIVVSHPLHREVEQRLAAVGRVVMNPGPDPWPPDDLRRRLSDADAFLAFMTDQVDDDLLRAGPRLKVIAAALKGYDNFDTAACTRQGVWLTIVPDLLTAPTAELAIGLTIAAARHLRAGDARVRCGGWRADLYGTGLAGSTVAVIGMGRLGRAIVDRLTGFGCGRLLGVDPGNVDGRAEPADLRRAFEISDVVLLALPLTPATHGLIGRELLASAGRTPVLVNVGRGSVVDESAVAAALEAGQLRAYAADVFAFEDWALAGRPPCIDPALLAHPSTVFTPHLGSAVARVRLAIEHCAADNLLAALAGRRPTDAVNDPTQSGVSPLS
jgi:phosphonate dehydrogenase